MADGSPLLDAIEADLARRARISEWVARERRERRIELARGPVGGRRLAEERWADVDLYRDLRGGRGSARFVIGSEESPRELISRAGARARFNVGPPWRLPRPAAPARVEVADEEAFAEPQRAADRIAESFDAELRGRAALKTPRLSIEVVAGEVEVRTSAGFASSHRETEIAVTATLVADSGGPVEWIRARARRTADLDLTSEIDRAARRIAERRSAAHPGAGRYDVVLREDALTGPPPTGPAADRRWFGPWLPLVAQASATLARQGLSRYRTGQSIYGAHPVTGDRLTLRSDGTLPHGLYSAPFGDRGEPVRTFDLVRAGVAAGHALDVMEAGLRSTTPNGGVRNLVVAPGPTPVAALRQPAGRPLIDVVELAWLEVDPRTGALVAEIGLGYAAVGGEQQPIAGGTIRGDLFALLAGARYAQETARRRWFHGPVAIRLADVEVA